MILLEENCYELTAIHNRVIEVFVIALIITQKNPFIAL
jgi:hypothetical protein